MRVLRELPRDSPVPAPQPIAPYATTTLDYPYYRALLQNQLGYQDQINGLQIRYASTPTLFRQ